MAKSEFAYSKAWRGGQNLNPVVDSVLNNISDFLYIKRPKRRFSGEGVDGRIGGLA